MAKTALAVLLFSGVSLALTACDLLSLFGGSPPPSKVKARISIGSAEIPPGEVAVVGISVTILTGSALTEIQVGPHGALVFDPGVIRIKGITGVGGFVVLASDIDNDNGEARFAAADIHGSVKQGEILEIEVEAVGRPGESSELKLTGVDVLQDEAGNEITPVMITDGEIGIGSGELRQMSLPPETRLTYSVDGNPSGP